MRVGDLTTELVNEWEPGQRFIILEVTDLESCESEGKGVFVFSLKKALTETKNHIKAKINAFF